MQNYRKTSHTTYDCKYHIVWITKYRKKVLGGEVGKRVRELLREICKTNDVEILKGLISKDHVHLFVSVPPPPSFGSIEIGTVFKRKEFIQVDAGEQASFQTFLGTSSLG